MCFSCEQKHRQDLAQEQYIEERRKQAYVNGVISSHPELRMKIMNRLGLASLDGPYLVDGGAYEDICSWAKKIAYAKNLELAKRYEDAARAYETLGLWKEAGMTRDRKSARTVKHVTVNLNDLIEKVRDGGLTIPFRCQSCGATITINSGSSPDGLRFCAFCGSAVDPDSLLDIVRNALK